MRTTPSAFAAVTLGLFVAATIAVVAFFARGRRICLIGVAVPVGRHNVSCP